MNSSRLRFPLRPLVHSPCLVILIIALGFLSGCKEELTPEEQVRIRIGELEANVREGDLSELKKAISENYIDKQGRDRKAMESLLTYWFLRNKQSYVVTQVVQVDTLDPGRVRTDSLAVLAGSPIPAFEDLSKVHGDFFRFDIGWILEGDVWRISDATWRFAQKEDLQSLWKREGS